jgi:hypothetical protein
LIVKGIKLSRIYNPFLFTGQAMNKYLLTLAAASSAALSAHIPVLDVQSLMSDVPAAVQQCKEHNGCAEQLQALKKMVHDMQTLVAAFESEMNAEIAPAVPSEADVVKSEELVDSEGIIVTSAVDLVEEPAAIAASENVQEVVAAEQAVEEQEIVTESAE